MAVDTAPRSARQHCDTHSVDYLGLPKAACERLKRKKESLLLLSMIQDTDTDVGADTDMGTDTETASTRKN